MTVAGRWHLRVAYQRAGRVGAGYYVIGRAVGQPTVEWGPFLTEAEAEVTRARLEGTVREVVWYRTWRHV